MSRLIMGVMTGFAILTGSLTAPAQGGDIDPPAPFTLDSPANNAWANCTPTFRWNAAVDTGSGIASYELWMDGVVFTSNIPGTSYTTPPETAVAEIPHTWRVRAYDGAGNRRDSATWTVRMDCTPPTAFAITAPDADAWITNNGPAITWDASSDDASGLNRYDVRIGNTLIGTRGPDDDRTTLTYKPDAVATLAADTFDVPPTADCQWHGWWNTVGSWQLGTGQYASQFCSLMGQTVGNSNITDSIAERLGTFDLRDTTTAFIVFWHEVEFDARFDTDAVGRVEVSTDNGLTWEIVHEVTASTVGWSRQTVSLEPYIGVPALRLRVRLTVPRALATAVDRWYLDHLYVIAWRRVPAEGINTATVTAIDAVGNTRVATRNFGFDTLPPIRGVRRFGLNAEYGTCPAAGCLPDNMWDTTSRERIPNVGTFYVLPFTFFGGGRDRFAIWRGLLQAPLTGTYTIHLDINRSAWGDVQFNGFMPGEGNINLTGGRWYPIRIRWYGGSDFDPLYARLRWMPPNGVWTIIPASRFIPDNFGYTLIAPANGVWMTTRTPTFRWEAASDEVSGLDRYDLKIRDVIYHVDPVATEITLPDALADGVYGWTVDAVDVAGNISHATARFTLGVDTTGPVSFDLRLPADGAATELITPEFAWAPARDLGSGLNRYALIVNGAPSVEVDRWSTSTTPGEPLAEGRYTWTVEAIDNLNHRTAARATWALCVDFTAPGGFDLLGPTDGAVVESLMPTFAWLPAHDDGCLETYELWIDGVRDRDVASDATSAPPDAPLAIGLHQWTVWAVDGAGHRTNARQTWSITVHECRPGATEICTGESRGECDPGQRTCDAEGRWGACSDIVEPHAELCNGLDDDCDGQTDEGTMNACGGCTALPPTLGQSCDGPDDDACSEGQWVCNGRDTVACNDLSDSTLEACDGRDNDCDGQTDEVFVGIGDACVVGQGTCASVGRIRCAFDGIDVECSATAAEPADETCNALDDDCDGQTDEGTTNACGGCVDLAAHPGAICDGADGDACPEGTWRCAGPNAVACDDNTDTLRELCNGLDDDCDGAIDERFPEIGWACVVGTGACAASGEFVCADDRIDVTCRGMPLPAGDERCNGSDDDCDGQTDEGTLNACGGCEELSTQPGSPCDGPDDDACPGGTWVCLGYNSVTCDDSAGEAEVCDAVDNDCDGRTDEADDGATLVRSCYDGAVGTQDIGACRPGRQACAEGAWNACAAQVVPQTEEVNGVDDDCDGVTDERVGIDAGTSVALHDSGPGRADVADGGVTSTDRDSGPSDGASDAHSGPNIPPDASGVSLEKRDAGRTSPDGPAHDSGGPRLDGDVVTNGRSPSEDGCACNVREQTASAPFDTIVFISLLLGIRIRRSR